MDGSAEFDVRIEAGGVGLTERDRELLTTIAETGSLNAAAEALSRSYAHAQRRVVELEEAFGPLVERSRGGAGGGGSELTQTAAQLLAHHRRLQAEFDGVAQVTTATLPGTVTDREGELADIDTEAGPVRAVATADATPGTDVVVTVKADAVTLHAPAGAPEPGGTSARNRFDGNVEALEQGESIALATVAVAPGTTLPALVTDESVATLALAPDAEVVATFKATATRAVPAADDSEE
jgi:molybdate transport system regulatory protein